MMFGHTHLQGGFVYQEGRTHPIAPGYGSMEGAVESTLTLTPGARYLINPGSVGQPRDGDWRAAFALYEKKGDAPAQSDLLSRALPRQTDAGQDFRRLSA